MYSTINPDLNDDRYSVAWMFLYDGLKITNVNLDFIIVTLKSRDTTQSSILVDVGQKLLDVLTFQFITDYNVL